MPAARHGCGCGSCHWNEALRCALYDEIRGADAETSVTRILAFLTASKQPF